MKNTSRTAAGRLAALILSLGALLSCDISELGAGAGEVSADVQISVRDLSATETRSSLGGATEEFEGSLRNMVLFQFSPDSTLYKSYYFPNLDGKLSVQGRPGVSYTFVGLMNMGDMTGEFPTWTPYEEVIRYVYHNNGIPLLWKGCPMSCRDARVTMSREGSVLRLDFTRLMARYDFRIDCSHLRHGTFTITNLSLMQAPSVVSPLLPESRAARADETRDGDYACISDINALKQGLSIPFYVLENAQGVLLSGNTDPWAKVPSNLGDRSGVCTYIEISGMYRDLEYKMMATHTYRMYLGDDSTSDFNIRRGTRYDLTLTLSDDGFLRASWKAERTVSFDYRTMRFDPASVSLRYGESRSVSLIGGDGCSFTLSADLIAAGVTFDPVSMTLASTRKLGSDVTGTLTATSWDGAVTATCSVTALKHSESYVIHCYIFFQWHYNEDQRGEVLQNSLEEWMYFRAVKADGTEVPCRFKIPGYPGCDSYQDRHSVWTDGDIRGYGPADMPERQMTQPFLTRYPLNVTVNGEEYYILWNDVVFHMS